MDYRTPLQHLLSNLLPSRQRPQAPAAASAFADTCRDADPAPSRPEPRSVAADKAPPSQRRQSVAWAESSIELMQGTEIMELPDDTAADLMDEYFAEPKQRAA